jgi:hypothetical protein
MPRRMHEMLYPMHRDRRRRVGDIKDALHPRSDRRLNRPRFGPKRKSRRPARPTSSSATCRSVGNRESRDHRGLCKQRRNVALAARNDWRGAIDPDLEDMAPTVLETEPSARRRLASARRRLDQRRHRRLGSDPAAPRGTRPAAG